MEPIFLRALSKLELETQYKNLRCGDFNSYASALELQGRLFESRSVAIELAVAAMVCYFEVCQLYLSAGRTKESIAALSQFISASQLVLIQGFTMQYQQRRQELEQRLQESEQHFRRFSIHVVGLYEQTGRRIARDLHDEIGHNLLVLKLYLELMSVDLSHGHSEQISGKIEEAVSLIAHAIEGVRRLAFNLGPAILEKAGLVATVRRYAGQFTRRTGINVQFHIDVPIKLPSIYEVTLYRVLQGALSNVVAHSKAENVEVNLGVQNKHLWMSVEDNGQGFDVKKTLNDPSRAFGLMAIRQRVELLGGSLRMESRPKRTGKRPSGTRIEIQIPLEGSEAA